MNHVAIFETTFKGLSAPLKKHAIFPDKVCPIVFSMALSRDLKCTGLAACHEFELPNIVLYTLFGPSNLAFPFRKKKSQIDVKAKALRCD